MRLFLLFSFLICLQANAKLGETIEKCKERYGNVITSERKLRFNNHIYRFKKNGHDIYVTIYEDVCHEIKYVKITAGDANKVIEENISHPMKNFKKKLSRGLTTGTSNKYFFHLTPSSVSVSTLKYHNFVKAVIKKGTTEKQAMEKRYFKIFKEKDHKGILKYDYLDFADSKEEKRLLKKKNAELLKAYNKAMEKYNQDRKQKKKPIKPLKPSYILISKKYKVMSDKDSEKLHQNLDKFRKKARPQNDKIHELHGDIILRN